MAATATVDKTAPQRLKMSYEDYLAYAGESQIVEWDEGEVIVYTPPIDLHQDLVRFLIGLLDSFIVFFNLGVLRPAPFEVKLWPDGPSREPDIFFFGAKKRSQLTDKRFEGAPDLMVEIISPDSVSEDRVRKFTRYEQAGVKEYWIIDPRPHQQQVDFYALGNDNQYHAAPVSDDGRYYSAVLPNFWLKLDWLWAAELPNPQLALAEAMVFIESLPAQVKTTYQSLYDILQPQKSK